MGSWTYRLSVSWLQTNESPNLVLYLVRRTKIVVLVLTLRLRRIGKVYHDKPKEPPNLALYLVQRTKIVVFGHNLVWECFVDFDLVWRRSRIEVNKIRSETTMAPCSVLKVVSLRSTSAVLCMRHESQFSGPVGVWSWRIKCQNAATLASCAHCKTGKKEKMENAFPFPFCDRKWQGQLAIFDAPHPHNQNTLAFLFPKKVLSFCLPLPLIFGIHF